VGRLFGPGSSTQDIAVYIREWFQRTTGDEPFVAPPPPASSAPDWSPNADAVRHHAPRPAPAAVTGAARSAATRSATTRRANPGPKRRATAGRARTTAKRAVKRAGAKTARRGTKRRGR
jgi:hypothetical protein